MRRHEAGSALIITVLVMLLLGAIGLSALDTVMRDQQVAGFQNRSSEAFYAAEAGVAAAKDLIRQNVFSPTDTVNFATYASPVMIGDTSTYPYGQPRYYGDPKAPEAIQSLNQTLTVAGAGGSNMRQGTGANWNKFALMQIRVAGQTPDGAVSRIEVVTTNQMPGGY
jgi:Tfp pilus assembly protein PilX